MTLKNSSRLPNSQQRWDPSTVALFLSCGTGKLMSQQRRVLSQGIELAGDHPRRSKVMPVSLGHPYKRIAKWLATEYTNPTVPLGSIELLLSPAEQIQRPDGTPVTIDEPTMANIEGIKNVQRGAFEHWFARCNARPDNIALFYFAGHGITTASQYLLVSDFGDPARNNLWENCIDFDGLRLGMRSNAANTQLFFVDACREKPIDALAQLNPNGNPLCSAGMFTRIPDSSAYFAAADGLQAYGPANDITYFAQAILESLEGAGARQRNGQWIVDTFQLGSGLGVIMNELATEHQKSLSCNPNAAGKLISFHYPPAPRVRASVGCQTPQANAEAEIELTQGASFAQSAAGEQRPWKGRLQLGPCQIKMTFQTLPPRTITEKVTPPLWEHTEPV